MAVILDFMNPFDKVWHGGLLFKLLSNGISATSVAWLYSYLSDRTLQTRVGHTLSSPQHVSAGVPQVSHLGPVRFLLFINNLPSFISLPSELYSDDALLHPHCPSTTPSSGRAVTLQTAIISAEDWALSWHGKFRH